MQAAVRLHDGRAGAQSKVACVPQNYFSSGVGNLLRRQRFDRSRRADRHKDGRFHRSARGMKASSPRSAFIAANQLEFKRLAHVYP